MAETAKSSDSAETAVTEVEELAEQQTSASGASEKANQTVQDGDAEAPIGGARQDTSSEEQISEDPKIVMVQPETTAEQHEVPSANPAPVAIGQSGSQTDGSSDPDAESGKQAMQSERTVDGASDDQAANLKAASDAAKTAGSAAMIQQSEAGEQAVGDPRNGGLQGAQSETASTPERAAAEANQKLALKGDPTSAEAKADRQLTGDHRTATPEVPGTGAGLNRQPAGTDALAQSTARTQAEQKTAQSLAATAPQSEAAKEVVKPSSAQQTQPVEQQRTATPIPVEAAPPPVREKFEARRGASDQIQQNTAAQTAGHIPQGTYSTARFGLGAGALTAAMPSANATSALALDSLTSAEAGGAKVTGGSTGMELPGLAQLLTEATVSPGTVHKPETPRLIANQMAEALAMKGDRNVDVALNPKELGHVNMRVSVTDTGVSVMIQTERAETGDLMRRHINELADEFRRMGFEDISFQFSGGETSNQGGGHDASHTPAGRSAGRGEEEMADLPVEPMTQSLNLGEVGLDMRM
ncbi:MULTISPECIES: flagellar hook-length control protein FliK [unclassified Phaeobacter]|uniref:flagellar hook-length control protein FliK n=1 Tax=unclassified Phaeobacter TaxID=2621772 RepID=UPI003A8AA2F8